MQNPMPFIAATRPDDEPADAKMKLFFHPARIRSFFLKGRWNRGGHRKVMLSVFRMATAAFAVLASNIGPAASVAGVLERQANTTLQMPQMPAAYGYQLT